jgi:hypothetical protein
MDAPAPRESPAFAKDPLEILSMDLDEESIVCNTVESGRLRVPLASIEAVQQCHVKLSKREGALARDMVEMVAGGAIRRRLQLHERTFSVPNSKDHGQPMPISTFAELEGWLEERFGKAVFTRIESEISYAEHEAMLKRKCLQRIAEAGQGTS